MRAVRAAGIAPLVGLLCLAQTAPGVAEPPVSGAAALEFSVLRNGERIGFHRIAFREADGLLHVDIRARIAVRLLFVTVYRFEHDAREVWRDGRLISLWTKTHDDGADHVVTAAADGDGGITLVGDGRAKTVAGDALPMSFWTAAMLKDRPLFNPLVGEPIAVDIAYRGEETVPAGDGMVRARRYSVTGDVARELWYGPGGELVRMSLIAKDGSEVRYVLDRCPETRCGMT